ncbi:fibronectin type III domain-containing protein [Paenibacillus periandrae]|uniref:fibronectin type III domain-containing protein n=1 Tax=Paenibacillus periandrae TaxID=1761741 RepID=UPI001F0912DD|nr:S8 family serine peptidase [Paenibacillus periandrae]
MKSKWIKVTSIVCVLATLFSGSLTSLASPIISNNNSLQSKDQSSVNQSVYQTVYQSQPTLQKFSYLVTLKDGVDTERFLGKKQYKNQKIKKSNESRTIGIELNSNDVEDLSKDLDVAIIEKNPLLKIPLISPLRNGHPDAEQLKTDKQITPWGIHAIGADLAIEKKFEGSNIKVALLDTGIGSHLDLNVKGGISFVENNRSYVDDNGHGTQVAGTLAAVNNHFGVVGTASKVDLYAVKVLDSSGVGDYAQVIQGIDWAIQNKMNIISMSFGGSEDSKALHQAIKRAIDKGILVIAAAGNNGSSTENPLYPARFSEVISVGAVDKNLQKAWFSSTGEKIDLMAPGTDILSTSMDGQYSVMSGTSMAVPHVTGSAAALWSVHQKWNNSDVKNKLIETATNLGDVRSYGHGLVNMARALNLIEGPVPLNTRISSKNVLDKSRVETDKTLLGLGNRLLYLSEKAYKQNNMELFKTLTTSYYDLLQKNVSLHKANSSNGVSNTTIKESVYGVVHTSSEKNEYDQLIQEYETVIGQYDHKPQRRMSITAQSITYPAIGLDTPFLQDNNVGTNFEFTPPSTGVYQFILEPIDKESSMDITCDMVTPQGDWVYHDYSYIHNKTIVTVSLEGGITYPIEIMTNMSDPRSLVTVSKKPIIDLNLPIDVSLPEGQFTVFKFTPTQSFDYTFKTIGYGGFSPYGSDSLIGLYTDANLSNLITASEMELSYFLNTGVTYYIKLAPLNMDEIVHTRIQIVSNSNNVLLVDAPTDVDKQGTDTWILNFIPPTTGNYNIATDYFGGIETDRTPPYTVVSVYDETLFQLFGWGYGSVNDLHLDGGRSYYVKIKVYTPQVKVRVAVTLKDTAVDEVQPNTAIDVMKPYQVVAHYKFTPGTSGKYVFWTSSYGDQGSENDTILEIYNNPTSSNLLATNDNYNSTRFSRVEMDLHASTPYYISLRSNEALQARFMVAALGDSLKPTNLTTMNIDNTSLLLSWKAALNKGNVSNYNIYNGASLIGSVGDSTTTYIVTGLNTNTNYSFTVEAKDTTGNISVVSNAVSAIIDTQAPTVPTNIAVSGTTGSTVTLTWTASTDNVSVSGYDIYNGDRLTGSVNGSVTTYTITGLTGNMSYSFTVKAKDAAGNISAASDAISVYVDNQPPSVPTNLSLISYTPNSVIMTWWGSIDNVGVTGYDVLVNGQVYVTNYGATNFTVSGLNANTTYSITVKARDAAGNVSAASNALSVYIDTLAPSTPTNLSLLSYTPNSVSVAWAGSTDNVGVTGYDVFVNGQAIVTNHGTTRYTVNGLNANTTYSITVKARDAAGNVSAASNVFSAYIDTQAPSVPTNLTLLSYTPNSATIAWTGSTDNVGVLGYDVRVNGQFFAVNHVATSYTVNGLNANTTLSITVRARDMAGNVSADSNALSVYIDTQAPSIPTNLMIASRTVNSASITWAASTDNVGVTGYDVYVNGQVVVTNHGATSYTVNGLNANTTYSITVKARDAAGNVSAASKAIKVFWITAPHYVYDANGRLDYIQMPSGQIIDYQYDNNGNMTKVVLP